MTRRVVVTGLGPVSAIGTGREAFWQGLLRERSAITRVTRFDTSQTHAKHAAEISDFNGEKWFPPHRLKRLDRFGQFCVVSAKLALEDAGLAFSPAEPQERVGVSFGSALGGIANAEEQCRTFVERGPRAVDRALALMVFGGSANANIAMEFGLMGPGTTNSNSCASANVALGDALRIIREGAADVMVAGGAEAPLSALTFTAFDHIKTMSRWQDEPPEVACRPFDRQRDGFVMSEGAGALVLEEYEHASRRGARIYGEILASTLNNDAWHMTSPRPDGRALVSVMKAALEQAGLNPEQVGYVNAHASSTQMNDANEAECVARVFGSAAEGLPVSGTKAYHGHPLGAAAGLEAITCLLAMTHGWLPPTLHLEETDPGAPPLDFLPKHGREAKVNACLNNSFGFGGINSCLVLAKV